MRTLRTLVVAAACALVLVPLAAARTSQPSQVRAAFFANWDRYARGYFVNQIPADRINIDWEYPGIDPGNGADHSPADKHNATLLFQEFRSQLDAYGATTGKHYLLTADLPAGNVNSSGSFELADVAQTVDWVNLLT